MSVITRTSNKGEARCQAFLQVAAELFLEKGFEATSVNEVVRRAGGSLATLYAHFPSKESLFEAIISDLLNQLLEPLENLQDAGAPVADVLRTFGNRHIEV